MNVAIFTLSDMIVQGLMTMCIGYLICNAIHDRSPLFGKSVRNALREDLKVPPPKVDTKHKCPRCEEKLR